MERMTRLGTGILMALFCIVSVLSLGREISNTLSDSGAIDLHMLWYFGDLVRHGKDPYLAFHLNQEPALPADTVEEQVPSTFPQAPSDWNAYPIYPPAMYILFCLFAFFSWPTAKILWMICNIVFMLMIPWLTIRLWSEQSKIKIDRINLLLALSFWAFLAARNAIGLGQTSLMVLALMLTTLFAARKNWILAGLALGLALSKYTLSFPILLFLLWKRDYRVVAVGILAQIIGTIALLLITATHPLQIVNEYASIVSGFIGSPGANLASIFPGFLNIPISLIFSLVVLGLTGYWVKSYYRRFSASKKVLVDMHILTILILWAFLAVYHSEYDSVVYILFVSLILNGLGSNTWRLSDQQKVWLSLMLGFFLLWMIRPGSIVLPFLPAALAEKWLHVFMVPTTLILGLSLVITIMLLYRLAPQPSPSTSPAASG